MARKLEEINAGSMADIAFLLLIFFLVTTTMEVDAGISRNLPIKRDMNIPQVEQPKIHDRDILVIMANSQDALYVEGEIMEIDYLEAKVREFYTANAFGEKDETMPAYEQVTAGICNQKISELRAKQNAAAEAEKKSWGDEIEKWEKKLKTLEVIGKSSYYEISNQALIQLKNQAGTTYGLYIHIQDILKKVVNDLRNERCREYNWGELSDLDKTEPSDLEKIEALQVLVPERIIEAKIEQ